MAPDRLKDFEYTSPGAYFVTINAIQHRKLFSTINNGQIALTSIGKIVKKNWTLIPAHFSHVKLGLYRIMPDHIHSILQIRYQRIDTTHELVGAKQKINKKLAGAKHASHLPKVSDLKKGGTNPGSLSAVIQSFKSSVTRELNQRMMFQGTVWKKGFHDRIIRDEKEMERIFSYIEKNPYRE